MVTSGNCLRSMRPSFASSGTCSFNPFVCLSTPFGQWWGISKVRSAISISMPGAICSPNTSIILPIAFTRLRGRWIISTTTICPWRAPLVCSLGIIISWLMRLSSGITTPTLFSKKYRPTMGSVRGSTILAILASRLPRLSVPLSFTSTLSPWNTVDICALWINKSFSPSSRFKKPKPSRCPITRPWIRSSVLSFAYFLSRLNSTCPSRSIARRRRWMPMRLSSSFASSNWQNSMKDKGFLASTKSSSKYSRLATGFSYFSFSRW